MAESPFRIERLEACKVTYPPDVVALPVLLYVAPVHTPSRKALADLNCFEDRSIAKPAAAYVEYLTGVRAMEESVKCPNKFFAMNVVPHLLSLIAKDSVGPFGHSALNQV